MFSCVFVIFPHGVPGQVWYLIVSIPDSCLLLYFVLFGINELEYANDARVSIHCCLIFVLLKKSFAAKSIIDILYARVKHKNCECVFL